MRVGQHLRAQVQCLARAAQHQHLAGRGPRAPLQVHIVGDGLAQRLGALRVAVQQHMVFTPGGLAPQALPHVERKGPRFRQARGEGLHALLVGHATAGENVRAARAEGHRLRGHGRQRRRRLAQQARAYRRRDETARSRLPLDITVQAQLRVRHFHRIARHAQRLRQRARGRQAQAGRQHAIEYQLAQRALHAHAQVERRQFGSGEADFQGVEFELRRHGALARAAASTAAMLLASEKPCCCSTATSCSPAQPKRRFSATQSRHSRLMSGMGSAPK